MSDSRYSYQIDLDSLDTSHTLAILSIPAGASVLDIGAADGSVARVLAQRGVRVYGVEVDPIAAQKAREVCEQVLTADVEQLDFATAFGGTRFDVVLVLDVLEHLRHPEHLLNRVRDVLAPNGRVIASIPNIAHGAVRLRLLEGIFRYTDIGLLDRTHVRLFDWPAIEMLFRDTGYAIVERLRVERGLTETEIPIELSTIPPEVLARLEQDVEATTYQFVVTATATAIVPAPGPADLPDSLSERLQRRFSELQTAYRKLEDYTRSLEDERKHGERTAASATDLRHELETRMKELHVRHAELTQVRQDLAVKESFIVELRERSATLEQADAALRADLASTREELTALRRYASSPGFRFVDKVSLAVRRFPGLYKGVQGVLRTVTGRR